MDFEQTREGLAAVSELLAKLRLQTKRLLAQVGDEGHKSQGSLAFVVGSFYVKLAAFEAPGQGV